MQRFDDLASSEVQYKITEYENVLREISNSNLMFILTNELIRIGESKSFPTHSVDVSEEQVAFLSYLRKISNKHHNDYPNLVFAGNYIKVGVLFIKKSKRRLDYYLDKLEEYSSLNLDNIYLLSIGYENTLFSKLIAKKFVQKSIYSFSWLQTLKKCPEIKKRSIMRLSKTNDLDSTILSSDEIDKFIIQQEIRTESDVHMDLKHTLKFITNLFLSIAPHR